jgi:hypothetical protein
VPLDRLRLAPDRDPWDQQPTETPHRHAAFLVFRDLGPGRTLTETAERLTKSYGHVRTTSAAGLWRERAQAWDLHRTRLADAVWAEEGRKAARATHELLNAARGKLAQSLATLAPEELTRSETIRLLEVVAGRHAALYGGVQTVTVTGPGGGPLLVDQAAEEFAALPLEVRAQRLIALGRATIGRARALLGLDDDDCECACSCSHCLPGEHHQDQDDG